MYRLKNIYKYYKQKNAQTVALKNITLTLPNKGLIFILGKSGSGKSTLLNLLGCLDTPSKGSMYINDQDVSKFSQNQITTFRSKSVGFIFQEFHIIESYSVAQNIFLPLRTQNIDYNEDIVNDILEKVQLKGYEHRKASSLSGGQKQRIAIARALVKQSDIILADEPTGALDFDTSKEIFEILYNIAKTKLVVVVSHDNEAANRYGNRIIEIINGQIYLDLPNTPMKEVVKISTDKLQFLDTYKINSLIQQGKQVVISNYLLPASNLEQIDKPVDIRRQTTKLSMINAILLCVDSMKKRIFKISFSIILSTISLAFIGVSILLASFEEEKVLINSYANDTKIFNIAKMKVEYDTLIKEYKKIDFSINDYSRLDAHGIDYLKKIDFSMSLSLANYINNSFYYNNSYGMIECDDLSVIDVKLVAGRKPKVFNEILITNYQFEIYKKYGFKLVEGKTWSSYSVASFKDLENKTIQVSQGNNIDLSFKIVGIINIDYHEYTKLLDEKTNIYEDENKLLYREFEEVKKNYLNYFFVKTGTYKYFFENYPIEKILKFKFENRGVEVATTVNRIPNLENIEDNILVYSKQSINKKQQAYVSIKLLSELGYLDRIENRDLLSFENYKRQTNNFSSIIGQSIFINASLNEDLYPSEKYTIAGVINSKERISYLSSDFLSVFYFERANSLIVPNVNVGDCAELLNILSKTKYTEQNQQYIYTHYTSKSTRINDLTNIFSLANSVFPLLGIIFIIFSFLLMFNLISQSINTRKKDIGILKALGINQLGVANIFIVEGGILCILNSLFATIISYISYLMLKEYLAQQLGAIVVNISLLSFTIENVIVIILICIITTFLAILFPIICICRKQPIELIRN